MFSITSIDEWKVLFFPFLSSSPPPEPHKYPLIKLFKHVQIDNSCFWWICFCGCGCSRLFASLLSTFFFLRFPSFCAAFFFFGYSLMTIVFDVPTSSTWKMQNHFMLGIPIILTSITLQAYSHFMYLIF